MKILKLTTGLLSCLIFFVFSGCSKDDEIAEPKAKVSFRYETTGNVPLLAYPNDELTIELNIASSSDVRKVVTMLDGEEISGSSREYTAGTSNTTYSTLYKVKTEDVGNTLLFVVASFDSEGNKGTKEFPVYIQSAKPNIKITIPEIAPESIPSNEVVIFDISVTSDIALKSIKTYLNNTELEGLSKTSFSDPNSDVYTFSYRPQAVDIGQSLVFVFEVMDANGNIMKAEYPLTVTRVEELTINEYYNIQMGAQKCTVAGPFMNAISGQIYVVAGSAAVSPSIDLIAFYSGSTRAYFITSPTFANVASNIYTVAASGADAMENWTVRNQTILKQLSLTPEQFASVNNGEMIRNYYNSGGAELETTAGLKDNDVVVFKTAAGKHGILVIKGRSANANTGYMTIDMKVEK
ncbi:hypothetical protein BDE36_2241 [Arcticibacter tournemirensis]|uniref:DUF5018 domain-containing protein n=1 Tax=Arcticibacter tournemirensis TaxID=699437 RepID=A0A5M9HEV1_9SPHI|nr:hypothetical protein [Arcticibacter tournemirensis]KAA8485049.1 hypothetical protein F1649_05285 [Arcticibacter tournemirensis]TQM50495.1 hypothetical protein BDE36_2241 [Arcticibacter tournemirensis]